MRGVKKPEVENAFTIPKKSVITRGKRTGFPRVIQKFHNNMNPITLPGSSKNPPPELMRRPK